MPDRAADRRLRVVVDVRGYAESDAPALDAVRAAVREREGPVWLPGPSPADPADPQRRCLVACVAGAVAGYGWLDWWDEDDGTHLYLLVGTIAPAYRGRGAGTALLHRQQERALAVAWAHGAAPVTFGGNADESQPDGRKLLLDNGFRLAFTAVLLTCDRLPAGPAPSLPGGLELRPVRADHHQRVHAAITECFAGSGLGYVEFTPAEYRDLVERSRDRLDLWCVAWDGDQVAGVVVNVIRPDGSGGTPWVAVRAPWRRRGLGLALLRHSQARLAAAGVTSATVGTVLENRTNSVGLYQRAGYAITRRQPRYRKLAG